MCSFRLQIKNSSFGEILFIGRGKGKVLRKQDLLLAASSGSLEGSELRGGDGDGAGGALALALLGHLGKLDQRLPPIHH